MEIKLIFILICLTEEEIMKKIILIKLKNMIAIEIDPVHVVEIIRKNTNMKRRRNIDVIHRAHQAVQDIENTKEKRLKNINIPNLDQEALSTYLKKSMLRRKKKCLTLYYFIITASYF